MLAPTAPGGSATGSTDPVNGETAEEREFAVSKFEAELLVRHWASELWMVHAAVHFSGAMGSMEARISFQATRRVSAIVDAGLLSKAKVRALFEEERQRLGLPPVEEWGPADPPIEGSTGLPLHAVEDGESVHRATVGAEDADLAGLVWHSGPAYRGIYTIMEVSGTPVHVYLRDLIPARHLRLPVVTAGVEPAKQPAECDEDDFPF